MQYERLESKESKINLKGSVLSKLHSKTKISLTVGQCDTVANQLIGERFSRVMIDLLQKTENFGTAINLIIIFFWSLACYFETTRKKHSLALVFMSFTLIICIPYKMMIFFTCNYDIFCYTIMKFESIFKMVNGIIFSICLPFIYDNVPWVILQDIAF
eukprot:UN23891